MNLKIAAPFAAVFGGIVLLFSAIGAYSIATMSGIAAFSSDMYEHPFTVTVEILEADGNVIRIHRAMKDIAQAGDDNTVAQMAVKIDELEKETNEDLAIVRERFLGDKSKVDKVIREFGEWKPVRDKVIALKHAGRDEEAVEVARTVGTEAVARISVGIGDLKEFASGKAAAFTSDAAASSEQAKKIVTSLYVLGCSITVAVGFLSIRRLLKEIAEQRRLEQSLRRNNRALRAVHACEEIIAHAGDENVLLQGICDVAVQAGYVMAWGGVLDREAGESIAPVAAAGAYEGYLDSVSVFMEEGKWQEFSTIDAALRTGGPTITNDMRVGADRRPWRAEALRRGFLSKITLPMRHDSRNIGVLHVYASEPNSFDAEAVDLLTALAQNAAVAIQTMRHRSGRHAAEVSSNLRERAIEACANAVVITSAQPPDYPIEYVNSAFERITGYKEDEVLGRSLRFLHGDDREQPGIEEIRAIVSEKREGHAVVRNYRKDGTPYWSEVFIAPVKDAAGATTHFVAAKYDITATKRYEAELEFHANRDALTGLANRNLLRDRLSQAIAYAARYTHSVWVVFINLDHFKLVNDTLGFEAGDFLLKKTAQKLQSAVRDTDTLARLGGDEFVALLPERNDEALVAASVQRIRELLAQPVAVGEHEFFPSCCIGVAVYPADGHDPDLLLKHAHIAMYRAKEIGNDNAQFYTPAMNERALDRTRIERDLRNALKREEFLLHYQPQVELRSGRIVGMEALLRWQHPELGMVSPLRFIGLAEETGMIVPIGAWVLRTACAQCKAWQTAGLGHLRVAVNLSVRQFAQKDLVQSIAAALRDSGLEAQYLDIELTESLVMADVEHAVGILRDLRALGVHLSIDDFGTGYSSLAYLKRFPITMLKIDQSFVQDITSDPDDAAIVRSVISLAHSLRLQVIAEGVETEAQLAYLRRHACDQMQGYYFSQPLTAAAFEQILRENKSLPAALEETAAQDLAD